MQTITRTIAGTLAAGAMAFAAVSPAMAQVVRGYGSGWQEARDWNHGSGWRDSSRTAVQMCVRTAENAANRNAYGRANVTDVRDVRQTRNGYEVRGNITVNSMHRGGGDRWRNHDTGSFKCRYEMGRVASLDIDGIRGL